MEYVLSNIWKMKRPNNDDAFFRDQKAETSVVDKSAMNNLVTSNPTHHPGRTLAGVIGAAVGAILVVLTVGLMRVALPDRGQRDANIGFEVLLRRGGLGALLTS